jgi:hypothetical protein
VGSKDAGGKTDEEFTPVVMELPDRLLDEMSEEERKSLIMHQKIESEFLTHMTQTERKRNG